jgi:diguanylate cyclase (GGDEF)-like protein
MRERTRVTSQPRDSKHRVPTSKSSLKRALDKNKKIKKTVKHAAKELSSINQALNQGLRVHAPVQTMEAAVNLNEKVEHQVAIAADDLHQVNIELATEVVEQVIIESELAETKADLAIARDDLSRSRANEEEARKATFRDALTGLPNRISFEQQLDQGLMQARRHGWGLAVLFVDLDEFKSINDSHGHKLGDKALLMVANRLQAFVRDEDTVSRWGGDEFMCLLLEVKQEADVIRLAEKMVDRIAAACEFDGIVLSVKASIGIAIYPADGDTADILFKNADAAMFKAKGTDKRVVRFQRPALD